MSDQLNEYMKDYWEHVLEFNPTFATYTGDHRYDHLLDDLSERSMEKQAEYFKGLLEKIDQVDRSALDGEGRINLMLIKKTLGNHLQLFKFEMHFLPLDHMQGVHIDFPQIVEFHPFGTMEDFESFIARLNAFSVQVDQVIGLLQAGAKKGITAFRQIIEHVIGQVETFTGFSPETSPMYAPVSKMGDGFSDSEKSEVGERVRRAIEENVTPSYKRLLQYLKSDYINHCRDKEGVWYLPDGKNIYEFFVNYHTTTEFSPDEIHAIGKREVSRIEGEIQKIMSKLGIGGSISDFAEHMKTRKELYPQSGEEIIDSYRNILSEMDKRLPEFFGKLPKAQYDVKAIEKYREQAAPAAYYYPPPTDFSRPGYFYANTYKPELRPKYEMEALSYHEAVPGHHLQIAIMQEIDAIPDFRRHEGSTAFIEGWALYAEKLSGEMGFYRDDFSVYGRLSFELWRAVRLVVDTGLHFYKWSRAETIEYCKENTGLEDHEIEVEVDRYIAMPGQALAYKVGELKILELREKARQVLGPVFSIKEFHDRILEQGALPLSVLEEVVNEWMSCRR